MRKRICAKFTSFALIFIGLSAGGRVAHASSYTWIGPTNSIWGSVINWLPAGIPQTGDSVIIGAGITVDLPPDITVADLSLGPGSTLTGGNVTVTNSLTMRDASLQNTGTLTIAAAATANLESSLLIPNLGNTINCPVSNYGTLNWNSGKITLSKDLYNQAGGNFNILTDATIDSPNTTKPTIYNVGTITKDKTLNQTTIAVYLSNSGWIDLHSGRINFGPRYIQSGGRLTLNGGSINGSSSLQVSGGIVDGSGTINGSVVNDGGALKPGHSPGSITINGNYTQTSTGVLDMEIGGLTPGTGYDQMIVNGTASLAGTLNIIQYSGFVPNEGDNFELLDYYSVAGNFTTVNYQYPAGATFTTALTPIYYVATAHVADSTPPTAAITSPLNNVGQKTLTTTTGTASDNLALASVTVQLYRYAQGSTVAGYWAGGTTWNTTYNATTNERLATGTTSWSLTLPALAAGQYRLRATAKDRKGNTASSTDTNFWMDNTVPATVTFTAPTSAAIVTTLSSIAGTATDNAGGSGIQRVDLTIKRVSDSTFWNGTGWATATTALASTLSGSTWTLNTAIPSGSLLPTGSYILTATAYDQAGNTKVLSNTITVDVSAPTVSVTAPVNNSTYTTLSSATGAASDVGSGIATDTIMLYRYATATTTAAYWGGSTTWTATYSASNERAATGTTSWSLALPALTYGRYYLKATAKDKAGNTTSSNPTYFWKSAGTSTLALSGGTASAAGNSVQLKFSGALDAIVAGDVTRYTVSVSSTGAVLPVQNATYSSTTNTVTITLPAGSLVAGTAYVIKWANLFDTSGKTITGQTTVTAGS